MIINMRKLKQFFCWHDWYCLEKDISLSFLCTFEDRICTKCGKRNNQIQKHIQFLENRAKKQEERKRKAEAWLNDEVL